MWVRTRVAPAGAFQTVYLDEGTASWTGFSLTNPEPLSEEEVVEKYLASDIIIQHELSYGGNYGFADIDISRVYGLGAVRIVCESQTEEEAEAEFDLINWVRVVKEGYDPEKVYPGFEKHSH
jgi:hypothetical protein